MNTRRFVFTIAAVFSFVQLINAQAYKNVDATTFNELIKSGKGLLLDVRTPGEYARGHIEGSTLISVADQSAPQKINMLQKDKPVYVYCLTGSRSHAVAQYMSQTGFKEVYNLQRGIVEWYQLGLPIVQSQQVAQSTSKTYSGNELGNILASNNLVLVNFHAPWCAPCKKMAPDIEKIKTNYAGKARIEKVDIDANQGLQSAFNIESIPGLVLYKNGKEVWRHTGAISYDELSKILESKI